MCNLEHFVKKIGARVQTPNIDGGVSCSSKHVSGHGNSLFKPSANIFQYIICFAYRYDIYIDYKT
jgi:hypothetical protein